MTLRRALASLLPVAVVGAAFACSTGDPAARQKTRGPDRASFSLVASVLGARCGSLDCHGSPYRNLRFYGYGGLRLDPTHRPDIPATTPAEIDATYDALVGLEPEAMTRFMVEGAKNSSSLIIVRKAHDDEGHKGGRRLTPGDDADRCVLGWLAGAVDTPACQRVIDAERKGTP